MNLVSKIRARNITVATLALLLLAGTVFAFLPGKAEALPSSEVEIFWVDDNGAVVGSRFRGCSGERYSDGVQTDNYILHSEPCNSGGSNLVCYYDGYQVSCAIQLLYATCSQHYGATRCSAA